MDKEQAAAIRAAYPVLLPSTLGRLAYPGYQFPAHLQVLQAAVMETMFSPGKNRLIIQMPVRHGKSHYCSYLLPAWCLITMVGFRVLLLSYGESLALEWGAQVLPLVNEWGPPLTGVEVNPDFAGRQFFRMRGSRGTFSGLGVGGSLAGRGADLIVADDVVKDQASAQSPTQRDKLFSTFWSEIMSRLEPDGKCIVVMSRRHPEDLSGRLLEMNDELPDNEKWRLVHFPAIRTDDDGSEHALWPERYDLAELKKIRNGLVTSEHSWQWWCLYQNDPMGDPAFKDFPDSYFDGIFYSDERPPTPARFRLLSFDPAVGSDKRTGDYAACLFCVLDRAGVYWVDDSFMERAPVSVVEDQAVSMVERHRPDAFICESNNFQEVIADNIVRKCDAKALPCPIFKHVNIENKEARIRTSLSHLLAQGKIRFRSTPANKIIVRQLREFPTGAHDDGPDALEMLTRLVAQLETGSTDREQPSRHEPLAV